jgi:glutamyl-tRNA reductase
MNLVVLSISYKLAPVEIRERLDLPESQLSEALRELRARCAMDELMALCTCNRIEFYFIARNESAALEALRRWIGERLGEQRGEAGGELERGAIVLTHRAAMIHLFRVASSLESMVVGEPQILGQVKEAYELAVREKSAGPRLMGLLSRAFHAAKRVRTETEIARNAVSVSFAAVELATKIFDTLADKSVLVIGAGEMAELAIQHLLKQGIRQLVLANRTFAHAVELSEKYQGAAIPYDQIDAALAGADIVISSTGARRYQLTPERVRPALRARKGKPMFFIDIAVPRDIDPAVNGLANAYCYDIDDLNSVIDANRREREAEALKAQHIVEEEVARYLRWSESLAAVPTIRALRHTFHLLGENELDKALAQLPDLTQREERQVRRLVHGLINKLLHSPSIQLKQLAQQGNGTLYAEAIARLFGLHPEQVPAPGEAAGARERPAQERVEDSGEGEDRHGEGANVLRFPSG